MFNFANKSLLIIFMLVVSSQVFAATPGNFLINENLSKYGYSKETIRMVNMQKARSNGKFNEIPPSPGRFKKFLQNLDWDPDITSSVQEFGNRRIDIK